MMNESGRTRFCGAWTGVLWVMAASALAGDWPAFRGPGGNGVAQEDKAPLHWGSGINLRWKAALPGPGNSSPIVSRGRVFVTCAESEGKKRNLYCFDRRTGAKLWVRTVEFPTVEPTHRSNPYCASTPVSDGQIFLRTDGHIYCITDD
jgi:outer membrane protein assembly factor BamB